MLTKVKQVSHGTSLPTYWRYIDAIAVVGIIVLVFGLVIVMHGAYIEAVRAESAERVFLVLLGIGFTIFGIIATIVLALLTTKSIKAELARRR